MSIAVIQPPNTTYSRRKLFAVDSEITLKQIDGGDVTQRTVTSSSPVNNGYGKTYDQVTMVMMKTGSFFLDGPGNPGEIG